MNDQDFDTFLRHQLLPAIGPLTGWSRRRHPRISSQLLQLVRVNPASGAQLDLVCKSTAWRSPSTTSRKGRFAAARHHQREPWCYLNLLEPATLGTPRCFGYSADHRWLLLEHIGGTPLTEVGDHGAWLEAARWLARFHRFGIERTNQCPQPAPLGRFDDRWSQRLWSDVVRHADHACLADLAQLNASLQQALSVWHSVVPVLVHGEFFPSNIHAVAGPGGWSITGLDWETTSWGPAAWDIAHLIAGWPPQQQDQMVEAYNCEAGADHSVSEAELRAARYLLALSHLGRNRQLDPLERRFDWALELTNATAIHQDVP